MDDDSDDWANKITPDMHILDLGSGHGGGSHAMAQRFGCKVTGFNLGPGQNALNMERCKELGIDHLVDAKVGNINEPLPEEWTGKFDAVWSCEVLCHAGDKVALFKELVRVLKPGGVFVFSDIMGADGADEKALKGFTDRNATTFMGRPSMYIDFIKESGFKYVTWWDGSHHLERYFCNMLADYEQPRGDERQGHHEPVPRQLGLVLTERADIQRDRAFSPGASSWRGSPSRESCERNAPVARAAAAAHRPRRKPPHSRVRRDDNCFHVLYKVR